MDVLHPSKSKRKFVGTTNANIISMIDTLISLKLVLLVLLSLLVLDEAFQSIQTADTVNFFAARASIVGLNPADVDRYFTSNVTNKMIFAHSNGFVTFDPIQTQINDSQIETKLNVSSPFDSFQNYLSNCELNYPSQIFRNSHPSNYCTQITRIKMP